jgi:uncharacterized DUF497 family protein
MKIEYDEAKNLANIKKHGVSFERVVELDWGNAIILEDDRFDYGEIRNMGYAMLENRLHILIWTMRSDVIRPISFRKSNSRERKFYETEKNA